VDRIQASNHFLRVGLIFGRAKERRRKVDARTSLVFFQARERRRSRQE
jgi:hypothetical protein